jgi:3-hydroxymyristoyl/3-hydroxydecanoyl-(acyl carrier protein) dehydratase
MNKENILQFIPQRYPFVMVDKLLHANETAASANFTVTAENIFCENGFFSEAGLLENIAQTVAAGNGYNEQMANKKVSGGFIARVKSFEVFFLPKINDELTTDVVVTGKVFNMTAIFGKIVCNNKTVAQCEMKIFSNIND